MSHVVTVELECLDLDALEEAAKALGLTLVKNKTTYRWYGTSIGDYPLPTGFTEKDLGHCDHTITDKSNPTAYEIGVVRRKDNKPGYQLLFDFWAGGCGLEAKVGPGAVKLKDHYGAAVAKKQLRKQGYRVQQMITTDGRIVVKAR